MANKPVVLFLCIHNSGRSLAAKVLLEHYAEGRVEVRSAGSEPANQLNPSVLAVLEERGLDPSGEFPKPLSHDDAETADVVVTMGCGDTCPVYPGKRYLDWELQDPAGLPVEAVRPIIDDIDRRVQQLLPELDLMMTDTPEAALRTLLDKQAVMEVVLRYCRGIDRLDMAMVRSCYHDDGIDHHTGFDGPADAYVAWVEKALRRFTGTMHLVGNCLVEIDGDRARSETYGMAHHWGEPYDDPALNFTSGFRYVDRLERRDGEWRIAERWAVREWTRLVPAETVRPKEGVGPTPRRDRTDPVYQL